MSDSEDFVSYGTPLAPLDEENYHQRKAPRLEDQIVTDKQGRRRFHGAFTGGFSAGYYNTVDTKEGWTPSTFVSSRSKKSEKGNVYTPMDFMDEDDLEEHGIAPQRVQMTSSYDNNDKSKRKHVEHEEGPIPGMAVLRDFLKPVRETIGINVLKKFGWKSGQGIGPRISQHKKREAERHRKRLYGCQPQDRNSDGEDIDDTDGIDFAPDDTELSNPVQLKTNKFGLGYVPLRQTNLLGNFDTHGSSLKMKEKNKKISIRGQAFGVGAFENDDEDIYSREDMSNYDFSLEPAPSSSSKKPLSIRGITDELEGFSVSSKPWRPFRLPALPQLPKDFKPVHVPRKQRFELNESARRGLGRHDLSIEDRQRIISAQNEEFADNEPSESDKLLKELLTNIQPTRGTKFKPFEKDQEKQRRYELYLKMKEKKMSDRYHLVQPKKFTEWEKERERKEFENTANLYRPMSESISARFTTGSHLEETTLKDGLNMLSEVKSSSKEIPETSDHQEAAKIQMYGKLTQEEVEWHPDKLLCKRFFVTHPYESSSIVGVPQSQKSIFKNLDKKTEELPEVIEVPVELPEIQETPSDKPEDYGLKVPIDGPPTMDLFKAIFEDSDSSDSGVEEIPPVQIDLKPKSPEIPKETERNVVFPHLVSKTNDKKGGIFSNLDFSQLNAYRYTNQQPESKDESSDDEYGPKPPPSVSLLANNRKLSVHTETDGVWVEKNSIKEKKSKKKKHKKDKKHKKSKR